MHAVIRTGGKQYRVAEGDVLRVEKLDAASGSKIELEEVLMVADGDDVRIGSPLLEGGKVTAEVCAHGRGDKIDVIKFKRRKKYRRKYGHRQDYTELRVTGIEAGAGGGADRKAAAKKTEKAADKKTKITKQAAPKKAAPKKAAGNANKAPAGKTAAKKRAASGKSASGAAKKKTSSGAARKSAAGAKSASGPTERSKR